MLTADSRRLLQVCASRTIFLNADIATLIGVAARLFSLPSFFFPELKQEYARSAS